VLGLEQPTRGIPTLIIPVIPNSGNVRFWPNAVISEHEIKRLPNVRFFAKKIFAPRNQFPIGALRIPKINQIVRPK
jgi:hypothetical protein